MAKDITLKTRNGETRYPKSVTALIYENGTGKTLQTIIDEMRQVDSATDTRTQHFKADVNNLDTLKNKTDIGLYNYVGTGWRGSVSVCYDSADNVSQVALSSSTPSYNGNTLTWISAQPCAMARTYTNGAWSHWEKVGAPVVNNLTTGGTDKALSAEMGKTLKEGLDALGPKISQVFDPNYVSGKYVDSNGTLTDDTNWGVTTFIPYTQGLDVEWLAGYTSATRKLFFYDADFNPITNAFWGATEAATTISASDIATYAPNGKWIRASYINWSNRHAYVKIGNDVVFSIDSLKEGIVKDVEDLSDKVETLDQNIADIHPDDVVINQDVAIWQNGYYIDDNGARKSYSSYSISEVIHLQAGDVLTASLMSSATAYLCQYQNSDTSFNVLKYASSTIRSFEYTADNDIDVVLCGSTTYFSTYTITKKATKAASEMELNMLKDRVSALEGSEETSVVFTNPYAGVDYDNPVAAQSHEHSITKDRLESAYNRGIRLFAVSHYQPSVPRYPLSKTPLTWMDYKSRDAVDGGDTELVERTETNNVGITQLDTNAGTINTDDIPQIANAERPYIHDSNHFYAEHFNILGLLWGDPGVWTANKESNTAWKKSHSLETIAKFEELLEDETMWQFGSQYAFGTINHNTSASDAKAILDKLPQIFKAMELFNQGYSAGWNQNFRNAYDAILQQGYRIWGTAVVDWQNDWATWTYTTDAEKTEWTAKFDALSQSEQQEYGSAENYYLQTGRYKFDRGANVLLMPNGYDSMTPFLQAKEGIKAYIMGRYYMVGLGNYSMRISIDGNTITFRVSDFSPKIRVITAQGATEYSNTDTVRCTPTKADKYVRFEAFWDDGDFVFSNPIFID